MGVPRHRCWAGYPLIQCCINVPHLEFRPRSNLSTLQIMATLGNPFQLIGRILHTPRSLWIFEFLRRNWRFDLFFLNRNKNAELKQCIEYQNRQTTSFMRWIQTIWEPIQQQAYQEFSYISLFPFNMEKYLVCRQQKKKKKKKTIRGCSQVERSLFE